MHYIGSTFYQKVKEHCIAVVVKAADCNDESELPLLAQAAVLKTASSAATQERGRIVNLVRCTYTRTSEPTITPTYSTLDPQIHGVRGRQVEEAVGQARSR